MTENRTRLLSKGLFPVLVLDDEIEITKSVARDLRRHANVESFTDAEEALYALEEKEFSVVISDLKMPKMSGLDFFEKARKIRPLCYRIVLTAFADLASVADSINRAQINLLLTKPWEASDLQNAVEQGSRHFEVWRENDELRKIALTDALTGVANHRYFWDRLDSEFSRAKRYGRPLCLIMADVDNFKQFNDQFGHQKGDEVLRHVANCFEKSRRSMDTVARYGGEEFTIILPEATRPQAADIAERYLEELKREGEVSASFGVAAYPDDASTPTELLHRADQALLAAKAAGKGQVLTALDLKKRE